MCLSTTYSYGQKDFRLSKQKKGKNMSNLVFNDSVVQDNSGTKKINLSAKTKYTDLSLIHI